MSNANTDSRPLGVPGLQPDSSEPSSAYAADELTVSPTAGDPVLDRAGHDHHLPMAPPESPATSSGIGSATSMGAPLSMSAPASASSAEASFLWSPLFLLTVFVVMLGTTSWMVIVYHMANMIGLFPGADTATIGWIMGLPQVLSLPMWLLAGRWIDRIGVTRVWLLGSVLMGLSIFAWGQLADTGPLAYLLRAGMLTGWAMSATAVNAYVMSLAPAHRQAEAIGTAGVGGFLGMLIGPTLAQALLQWHPAGPGLSLAAALEPYRQVMFASAGFAFVAASVIVLLPKNPGWSHSSATRRDDAPHHPSAGSEAPAGEGLIRLLVTHWPGWVLMLAIAMSLSFLTFALFLPPYLKVHGYSPVPYLVTFPLVAMFIRLSAVTYARQIWYQVGEFRLIVLGMGLYALGAALLPWWAQYPLGLVALGAIVGLGHGLAFPCVVHMIASRLPHTSRGLGSAVALGAVDAGFVVGGPLFGTIGAKLNMAVMFELLAVAIVLCSLVGLWSAWRHRQALAKLQADDDVVLEAP